MTEKNHPPLASSVRPASDGQVDFLTIFLCGIACLFIALAFFLS
jgi:hypothetical protein